MIIDFHTHVFPPWIKNNRNHYTNNDPILASIYSSPKAQIATTDDVIDSMDGDGIDISVVLNINWSTHELCVATNDYIMESIARFPKRLIGFGAVQLQSPDAALAEVERCARGGIRGIGEVRPYSPGFDISDQGILKTFIDALTDHNMILLTHASEPVGHQYAGKGSITPDVLYPLITGFPELKLVCAHWGGGLPFYALMPEVKTALNNVFFDTAASPFLYTPQIYQQVIDITGADKILFGTDYPLMPQGRVLTEVRSLNLPEETEGLILSGNARRLLGLE